MANEVRYTYNGKEVGGLRKLVSDVVVVEEQWINAANKFFANGYTPMLKFPKALIRQECGEELTDAQAWMLLHHLTNSGVPLALRDTNEDEKSRPAKVAGAVAGSCSWNPRYSRHYCYCSSCQSEGSFLQKGS